MKTEENLQKSSHTWSIAFIRILFSHLFSKKNPSISFTTSYHSNILYNQIKKKKYERETQLYSTKYKRR